MKNFVQKGENLTFTAAANVNSGDLIALGSTGFYGVSATDVATGEEGEATTEGVFKFPKATAQVVNRFDNAYWTGTEMTPVGTGNVLVGVFTDSVPAGDSEAPVKLIPRIG